MQGKEETPRTNVGRQQEKSALYPQEIQGITGTHRAIMTPKKKKKLKLEHKKAQK